MKILFDDDNYDEKKIRTNAREHTVSKRIELENPDCSDFKVFSICFET